MKAELIRKWNRKKKPLDHPNCTICKQPSGGNEICYKCELTKGGGLE